MNNAFLRCIKDCPGVPKWVRPAFIIREKRLFDKRKFKLKGYQSNGVSFSPGAASGAVVASTILQITQSRFL